MEDVLEVKNDNGNNDNDPPVPAVAAATVVVVVIPQPVTPKPLSAHLNASDQILLSLLSHTHSHCTAIVEHRNSIENMCSTLQGNSQKIHNPMQKLTMIPCNLCNKPQMSQTTIVFFPHPLSDDKWTMTGIFAHS